MFLLPQNNLLFLLTLFYSICVVIITIKIISEDREPQVAIGWLFAIVFLPYIGIIIYFLGGIDWRKHRIVRFRPEEVLKSQYTKMIERQEEYLNNPSTKLDSDTIKSIMLNLRISGGVVTTNNRCQLYFDGAEAFDAMIEDIRSARSFIHMEYYIWRSDSLGEMMADLLLEKATSGVQVRLIFDGVGCFRAIKWKYKRRLREGGVQFRYFLDPMSPLSGRLLNYRNHRKIAVIDGVIAYSGGMNMAEEYISGGSRFAQWRDTHYRIHGDAAKMLERIFLSDWRNSGGEDYELEQYLPPIDVQLGTLPTQIICSGPDSDWYSIKKFIFNMICNAGEEVIIQSPYFIPDDSILSAITSTALSGVKVKLIMTGVADKRIPYWAAYTYFVPLLRANVEIYLYTKGFYHSKVYLADSTVATVGTCNLDIRSFHLDYEVNGVFYDQKTISTLKEQFQKDLLSSVRLEEEDLLRVNRLARFRNSLARILSPIL